MKDGLISELNFVYQQILLVTKAFWDPSEILKLSRFWNISSTRLFEKIKNVGGKYV